GTGSSRPVPPAGSTTVAPGHCSDRVTLSIDSQSESASSMTRWTVWAVNPSASECRLTGVIKATIRDADGNVLTGVTGTRTAHFEPTAAYVGALVPDTPSIVAHLNWINPCSSGPVELEVTGFSPHTARLQLRRQPCADEFNSSVFSVDGPGPIAGSTCPSLSITLDIAPNGETTAGTTRWTVVGTSHANFFCRTHAGIDAKIETVDGTVLDAIPGNPARQGETYRDLFVPGRPEIVAFLVWTHPCSITPVNLVASFRDGSTGTLSLPPQLCLWGPVGTSHFAIDSMIPVTTR
ncbi:MAG: hypothetical protein QOH10_866, partial [Actinomycetota bacterium]|nr:hypothetical protein [Actinomycetota bacterium]